MDFTARGDGGANDGRTADTAMVDTAPCVWSAFSTPAALPGPIQSPIDDWCPTPTLDGLQMFMHTYRSSTFAQIWSASRASTAVPFNAAAEVTELTTGSSQQFDPTLTSDGLRIIFSDDKGTSFDLFEAVRTTPTGTFGTPTALATLNSGGTDWNGFVSADGLRLMFTSNRGSAFDQVFETTRTSVAAAFAAPTVHPELTVAGSNQWNPTLSADGLTIFFSSTRTGGPGGFDVYTAQRTALGQPFTNITLVPEMSSSNDDICLRLSPDGTTMYMSYDTLTAGGGNAELDFATRSCQ